MNFNFGDMFNGMFKPVANGYCKLGMNGKIAIKTSSGYKTFDIKKKFFIYPLNPAIFVIFLKKGYN